MALLEAEKLEKSYDGRRVLSDVSLQVERGETLALIGSTGAGKTTLLRLMDLLETPSSGTVYFDGVDVTHYRGSRLDARRRMSFVHQRPTVFTMNVHDNVACGLRWRRHKGHVVQRKVEDVLALVGMSQHRERNAMTLSGGETQRVAIARALVTDPELLLLDEPTANLDPASTAQIERVIADVIHERSTTVMMATHDMSQAQRLAGRIGIMIDGQISQVGSPQEIFRSPESRAGGPPGLQ